MTFISWINSAIPSKIRLTRAIGVSIALSSAFTLGGMAAAGTASASTELGTVRYTVDGEAAATYGPTALAKCKEKYPKTVAAQWNSFVSEDHKHYSTFWSCLA